MEATCPECAADAESVSQGVLDAGGFEVTFECPSCNHRWDVVF